MNFMRCVLFAFALLFAVALASTPTGTYCGSYSFGLVKGRVAFDPSGKTFDLSFHGLGADVKCNGEAYVYHEDSGVLEVPGASISSDCLGSVLNDNGLSLTATYQPDDDSVGLDLGLASLTATRC